MEFSKARSAENTEEAMPRANAPQHSTSNCAPEQPSLCMRHEKKQSDNRVIVLAPQAMLLFLTPWWAVLATRRHSLGPPVEAREPRGKGERACCFPRDHSLWLQSLQHRLTEQTEVSRPGLILSRLSQITPSQQHRSVSCCLSSYLPTTLEKQQRSAKNLQSTKSQNNDWPIQCFHPGNYWFLYKKTLWGESEESKNGMWLFLPLTGPCLLF